MYMPASEFTEWQAYFEIYPFSMDRFEYMISKICAFIYNTSGKMFKNTVKFDDFVPDYVMGARSLRFILPSLEKQKEEFGAFIKRYKKIEREAKGL